MAAEFPIARVLAYPGIHPGIHPSQHGKLVQTIMTHAPSAATGGIAYYDIRFETGEMIRGVPRNLLNFNGSSSQASSASSGQASAAPIIARMRQNSSIPPDYRGKLVETIMTHAPSAATGGIAHYDVRFQTGEVRSGVHGNLLNFNGSSSQASSASSGQASAAPISGIARIRPNYTHIPSHYHGRLVQIKMMQDPSAPGRNGIPLYNATLLDTHERIPGVSGDLLNFNVSASASASSASASSGQASSSQAAPKQSRGTARQIRPEEIAERSQPGLRKGKAVQLRLRGSRPPIRAPYELGYQMEPDNQFRNEEIGRIRHMKVKGLNGKPMTGVIAVDVPGVTKFILARPDELDEVENDRAFPTNSLRFRVGDIVRVIENSYGHRPEIVGTLYRVTEVRENGDLIIRKTPESWQSSDTLVHQSDVEFVSDDRNQGGRRRKTNRKKKNKNKSRRSVLR